MTTCEDEWRPVLQLAAEIPGVFPAVGLHPWKVDEDYGQALAELQALIEQQSVTALGEIGLDFAPAYDQLKQVQVEALERQLSLAQAFDLPVSLHVYKAHNELIALLKRYSVRGVIHSLGSSVQVAQSYASLGFKFGINAIVVRDNARRYHDLVRHFGLEHLVLETDYPNIRLPGRPVAKIDDISVVAQTVADILGCNLESVLSVTTANAGRVFNMKGSENGCDL